MNTSLNHFSRGIAKAAERRRAMQQQTKQHLEQVVKVQSVDSVAGDSNTITIVNNTITKLSDEEYRTTIIQKMVNHIRQKKEKTK
ncbi:hypothetical protein [Pseudomonas sp. K5002]|uniref:hypothetical protein n=1 Tax=Pseudomonas sp. K5002 TaxID=2738828 RepID=UPI0015BA3271|nr:hypothetical protein [Pseudomonas sp. K5002]NWD86181.1 hypothetical protein [Pseudomonas sp. K5002]